MQLPRRAQEIIDTLYGLHRPLFEQDDDTRRAAMRLVAEQLAFELGPAYGVKSVAGHPQGQSTIAYTGGPQFGGWRILDGDGSVTGIKNAPIPEPPWQEFKDQMFIAVDRVDHLGIGPTPTPVPEPPAPEPVPVPVPVPLPPIPPAPPVPTPVTDPAAPVPSGLQGVLQAAAAWAGQQLVTALFSWWSKRKAAPKPVGTVGSAIPRPTPVTRNVPPHP
jgi:hypothetical protein